MARSRRKAIIQVYTQSIKALFHAPLLMLFTSYLLHEEALNFTPWTPYQLLLSH